MLVQGADRGLGLALAEQLLAAPTTARLFATARDAQANGLAKLAEIGGDRVHPFALDIADETSIQATVDRIASHTDRLDLIIVCAGVLHDGHGLRPEKRLGDVRPENLQRSFAVNAAGPLLMLKHCERLLTHGERAVFASMSARVGSITDNRLGGWYAYRGAKAAQNQFMRTASTELRRKAKRAICVGLHPGTTDTALSKPFQRNVPEDKLFTPAFAAERLLAVIDGLTPADSGQVFAWDGQRVPE